MMLYRVDEKNHTEKDTRIVNSKQIKEIRLVCSLKDRLSYFYFTYISFNYQNYVVRKNFFVVFLFVFFCFQWNTFFLFFFFIYLKDEEFFFLQKVLVYTVFFFVYIISISLSSKVSLFFTETITSSASNSSSVNGTNCFIPKLVVVASSSPSPKSAFKEDLKPLYIIL